MERWVPEHERDTRWPIFNCLFYCRVPYLASRTVDDIKQFGMPISGDAAYDRQTANELVHRMITINQMIDYHQRGVQVEVVDPADTKKIYEHISAHLTAWANVLEGSLNKGNAPVDELLMMDNFANTVYSHAKYHFPKEQVDSVFARRMGGVMGMGRRNIVGIQPGQQPVEGEKAEEVSPYPERRSMAEIFSQRRTTTLTGQPGIKRKWNL